MQSEPISNLKKSPFYNKILQLMLAVVLIVVIMNIGVSTSLNDDSALNKHFDYVGHQYIKQTSAGIEVLLTEYIKNKGKESNSDKALQQFINNLTRAESINQIHLYDQTGAIIMKSNHSISINDLYGVSPHSVNNSSKFIPFVDEIHLTVGEQEKPLLLGYLRVTVEKSYLTKQLENNDRERGFIVRIMIVLAGVIGFLLTRGFNRFSRQGYRV